MEESNKCYPGTSRTRPEELEQRGKGDYCCVPGCHNSRLTKNGEKTKIGIFGFPRTNPEEMKKWTSSFKHIRCKDTFDPMKRSTQVCEFHFPIEDIILRPGSEKKKLKTGVIPSIFKNKITSPKQQRKGPKERVLMDGTTYYQVEWAPTWENIDDIVGCEKFIQEFHTRQEKEIFGGTVTKNKMDDEKLDEFKVSITNEISELHNSLQKKIADVEAVMNCQNSCNDNFSRRLTSLEESSSHSSNQYYDRVRVQQNPPAEVSSDVQTDDLIAVRDKDDESNNELYFEDMLYSEFIEDGMEPRRKRNRNDIALGVPVTLDCNLIVKIKERLEAANCVQKETEVLHAMRVCNIRHILALKLAQIIFSNEELASASYAPGNFNPLDNVKLSLVEDLSFMRFKTADNENREFSWGQIHQRIKNKCRCKRKEYNDKLSNSSSSHAGSFKISSVFSTTAPTSTREKTNQAYKNSMAYSVASNSSSTSIRNKFDKYSNYQSPSNENSTSSGINVYDLTESCSTTNESQSNSSNNNNSSDITVVCKEDESDYTDDM